MPMEPPPSRYRVVERGGRLVVIDSVVGGAPPTARELLPEVSPDGVAERFDSFFREGAEPEESPPPPRPAAARAMIAEPPGLLRNIASTACGDRRDGDGRLRWKTARWFDGKGPRTVTLTEAAEQQLGGAVLTLVVAAFVAVLLVVMGGMVGWVIVFAGFAALRQMKSGVTAWIDRLSGG